jgi:hypothetical protein
VFLHDLPASLPDIASNWRGGLVNWRCLTVQCYRRNTLRSFWLDIKQRATVGILCDVRQCVRQEIKRDSSVEHQQKYVESMQRLRNHGATGRDWEPARECISKAAKSQWWTWDHGSRLIFWEWKRNYSYDVKWSRDKEWKPPWAKGLTRCWTRDGQPHFVVEDFPRYLTPQ